MSGHIIPVVWPTGAGTLTLDASGSYASSTTEVTTHSPTIPTHVSGNLLVVHACWTGTSTSPASAMPAISGWTETQELEAGNASAVAIGLWTMIATGSSETITFDWTGSVTNILAAQMTVWDGPSSATPDQSAGTAGDSGADVASPTMTASDGDYLVIRGCGVDAVAPTEANFDDNLSGDSTMFGYKEIAGNGHNGLTCAIAHEDFSGTSPGAETWNHSSEGRCALSAMFAY